MPAFSSFWQDKLTVIELKFTYSVDVNPSLKKPTNVFSNHTWCIALKQSHTFVLMFSKHCKLYLVPAVNSVIVMGEYAVKIG